MVPEQAGPPALTSIYDGQTGCDRESIFSAVIGVFIRDSTLIIIGGGVDDFEGGHIDFAKPWRS